MATLKESALEYEPKQTKNIADLESVSVDLQLVNKEAEDSKGEKFTYKCIEVNNEEFRVPNKVIGDLKVIMEQNQNLKTFKVVKKGTGLETRYTVIPLT